MRKREGRSKLDGFIEVLRQHQVIRPGHVIHHDGRHGAYFIDRGAFCRDHKVRDEAASHMIDLIRSRFRHPRPEILIGADLHGALLADACVRQARAHDISFGMDYAEWRPSPSEPSARMLALREGARPTDYEGRRVVVVADIMTAGGTVASLVGLMNRNGAEVIGAVVLWQRARVEFSGLDVSAILTPEDLPVMEPDSCHLCVGNAPIIYDFRNMRHP